MAEHVSSKEFQIFLPLPKSTTIKHTYKTNSTEPIHQIGLQCKAETKCLTKVHVRSIHEQISCAKNLAKAIWRGERMFSVYLPEVPSGLMQQLCPHHVHCSGTRDSLLLLVLSFYVLPCLLLHLLLWRWCVVQLLWIPLHVVVPLAHIVVPLIFQNTWFGASWSIPFSCCCCQRLLLATTDTTTKTGIGYCPPSSSSSSSSLPSSNTISRTGNKNPKHKNNKSREEGNQSSKQAEG